MDYGRQKIFLNCYVKYRVKWTDKSIELFLHFVSPTSDDCRDEPETTCADGYRQSQVL